MLHRINFPVACRPCFDWIVTLQRRLLAGLCQNNIENPDVVDETWLLAVLGDLPVDRDWFSRFCNWKHEGQTLLERARCIAGCPAEIKAQLLADFENDQIFETLFDPQVKDAHDLVGLAPFRVIAPQVVEVIHRFFESFYNPALYRGYKIPIEGSFIDFDRERFLQVFDNANPNVRVCPMCDGDLGNPEVDHFFPKADYPYLSCHPLNLVPICNDCNGPGGKHQTPPFSSKATGHQTDDWFHPYLRSACDMYTIRFERQREGTTPVLTSEDEQAQIRLDNMSGLLKLPGRWRRALSGRFRQAQRYIRKECGRLGRPLTEDELCCKLMEWGKDSQEYQIGFIPFAIVTAAYFQQASQKEPSLFDELWVYNAPGVNVVTANDSR